MNSLNKILILGVLLFGGIPALITQAEGAVVLYAKDLALTAAADPRLAGVGDGVGTTTTPGWTVLSDIVLNRNVVGVAVDTAAGDPGRNARGIVQFGVGTLVDGTYNLSALVRTANIKNTTTGTARDQSFAIRVSTIGTATLNGAVAGSTGWLIVKPLSDDYSASGHRAPWLDVNIAGAGNSDYNVSGTWNTTLGMSLAGIDGGTGGLRIEVLDGTGGNYGVVYVDSFTFVAVPEPSLSILVSGSLLLVGAASWRNRKRQAALCG